MWEAEMQLWSFPYGLPKSQMLQVEQCPFWLSIWFLSFWSIEKGDEEGCGKNHYITSFKKRVFSIALVIKSHLKWAFFFRSGGYTDQIIWDLHLSLQCACLHLEQLISGPVRGYIAPKSNITQKNHCSSHLRGSINYLWEQGFRIYRPLVPSLTLPLTGTLRTLGYP